MSDFEILKKRAVLIREKYHELEQLNHGSIWTIEEDALAFLTDAGLVGRYTMSNQQRWPKPDTEKQLEHKLGECMWWLIVLAERMEIDSNEVFEKFLFKTETTMK